tara:strand:+ start:68 stop:250 length:183 start_codon:yes stop_codon:yes gene_type:complete
MIFVSKNGKYIEINKINFYNDIEYIKQILKVKNISINDNVKKTNIANHILDVSKKNVEIM